ARRLRVPGQLVARRAHRAEAPRPDDAGRASRQGARTPAGGPGDGRRAGAVRTGPSVSARGGRNRGAHRRGPDDAPLARSAPRGSNMYAWLAVVALGGGVGLAELVTRYRDDPSALWASSSFWVYVLINAGASALAFALIKVFGWTFGVATGPGRTTTQ